MSLASEQARIQNELEGLDEATLSNANKLLEQLTKRLLLLLGIVPSSALMSYYYKQLFDAVEAEFGNFKTFWLNGIRDGFDRYWDLGVGLSKTLSESAGVMYFPKYAVDKQILLDYILSEADSAASLLHSRLTTALNMALLKDGKVDEAILAMKQILKDPKTLRSLSMKVSSRLVGVTNAAMVGAVDELVQANPERFRTLTKTWNWSHVSRANHAAMDGETVPYRERFLVPGDGATPSADMFGPHDPSAPLGQVLNCKCTMTLGGL